MAGENGISRCCTSVLVGIRLQFSQRYCTKELGTIFVCSVSRMRGIYDAFWICNNLRRFLFAEDVFYSCVAVLVWRVEKALGFFSQQGMLKLKAYWAGKGPSWQEVTSSGDERITPEHCTVHTQTHIQMTQTLSWEENVIVLKWLMTVLA